MLIIASSDIHVRHVSRIHVLMRLPYISVYAYICVTLRTWIKIYMSPLSSRCGTEQRHGQSGVEQSVETLKTIKPIALD
jgi:hypothetical protein